MLRFFKLLKLVEDDPKKLDVFNNSRIFWGVTMFAMSIGWVWIGGEAGLIGLTILICTMYIGSVIDSHFED